MKLYLVLTLESYHKFSDFKLIIRFEVSESLLSFDGFFLSNSCPVFNMIHNEDKILQKGEPVNKQYTMAKSLLCI